MNEEMQTLALYKQDGDGLTIENFMNDRGPRGQLLIAAEYLVAAVVLEERHTDHPVRWSAYMIACQAIELSLKAALQMAGFNARDLKRPPFNHDLKSLLDTCLAMPEYRLGTDHIDVIEKVAPAMSQFVFRYGLEEEGSAAQPAKLHLPPLILLIKAAYEVRAVAWRLFQIWPDQYSVMEETTVAKAR
jgi:hypothetical protein